MAAGARSRGGREGETFWRMLNHEEFDVSEMSLSSYTILRSEGDERFIALPVFPSRVFRLQNR